MKMSKFDPAESAVFTRFTVSFYDHSLCVYFQSARSTYFLKRAVAGTLVSHAVFRVCCAWSVSKNFLCRFFSTAAVWYVPALRVPLAHSQQITFAKKVSVLARIHTDS